MKKNVTTALFCVCAAAVMLCCGLAPAGEEAKTGGAVLILADKLKETEGIALCPDGKLFTIENGSGKVYEIVDDDTVKQIAEGFNHPAGMACGPDNTLYVAAYGDGNVVALSPDGKKKEIIASGFKTPNGIAVAADGSVYMSDSSGGDVVRIVPGGEKETVLNGVSFANGLLLKDKDGSLLIAQTTANKIIETPLAGENKGKKKTVVKGLTMVDGITGDDGGNIYACLYSKGEIAAVDPEGNIRIIASKFETPATPVLKNGFLYITTLKGKGLYKLPLKASE